MSSCSAAWMTVLPSSTSTVRPSISILGMGVGARRSRLRAEGAARQGGVLLELGAVLGDQGARRHGRGVGQGADRVAHHVAGDVEQEVDVARRGGARLETGEDAVHPPGPLAARRALPARLVVEEALE